MVGNYGVAESRSESDKAHATGCVMRALGGEEWAGWLRERGLVALDGTDTRSLVLHLRERGAMRAALVAAEDDVAVADALEQVRAQPAMEGQALVARVSSPEPYPVGERGTPHVALVDYGTKRSIARRLVDAGAAVTVVPHTTSADELARYDGVVLSNGPGDPEPLKDEQATLCNLIGRVPILGICLGHQLLALATGRKTYKLPFGHRGANHPVLERTTNGVLVTAQNHGFAVAPTQSREETHISLYDGTVEGLELRSERARSVQFHPEAGPGPHDAWGILESWVEEVGGLAKAA
jgi:carbamoyl-phosphate synthase small subunit